MKCFVKFCVYPNQQKNSFYILGTGFTMSDMAWAYRPKPLLHGLSLKKSPIKNHATSFWVGSGRHPD